MFLETVTKGQNVRRHGIDISFDHLQQLTPLCSWVLKLSVMKYEVILHKLEGPFAASR
jgi:hypothetical protein